MQYSVLLQLSLYISRRRQKKEIAYDQFDDIMDSDEDFDDEFFDDDDEVLDPAEVMNKPEEEKG